jgi:tRNA(adenine34) deaminase
MEKMADSQHESYMRLCVKLAGIARERGEVPVGSIIVRDGAVIAEGIEGVRAQHDVAHHAEMEAIRRACQILQTLDLSGCTLYTSAEPCFMCSYAIRGCRIGTVVFGAPVNTVGGFSSQNFFDGRRELQDSRVAYKVALRSRTEADWTYAAAFQLLRFPS